MLPPIVVVGSINADLVARVKRSPEPGETVFGDSFEITPGGKGANQAVAAARLGAQVAMVGAVGDDTFAEPALAGLRSSGVDISAVEVIPGTTGIALIEVADDGENSIVVVPGANAQVTPQLVERHRDLIAGAQVLVLQGEIPAESVSAAVNATRGRVILNLAPVLDLDPALLLRANPLVVNELEGLGALHLLSAECIDYPRDGPHHGGNQYTRPVVLGQAEIAHELLALGVPSVVITLGAAGALVGQAGQLNRVVSPKVTVVDTTGAGDAFVGALATKLAAGQGLVEAAEFAARVGAYAVTKSGAQTSYPSLADPLP
ncbi:MAG: ribokinase [Promicromonosporaceae bacterium]|nr:ribokinase [Promicromonosporaceae bacterium]